MIGKRITKAIIGIIGGGAVYWLTQNSDLSIATTIILANLTEVS